MKALCVVCLVLTCTCWTCLAQTNITAGTNQCVDVPRLELLPLKVEPQQKLALDLAEPVSLLNASTQTLSTATGLTETEIYGPLRPNQFYLTVPEPRSENKLVRAAQVIFEPRPVQLGKVKLACPIITAIKKKNPLCLLNPLFVQVSW